MTMVERLLWLADQLSRQSAELKSPVVERRAVSTAYYAVFHALASLCTEDKFPYLETRRLDDDDRPEDDVSPLRGHS